MNRIVVSRGSVEAWFRRIHRPKAGYIETTKRGRPDRQGVGKFDDAAQMPVELSLLSHRAKSSVR
jgi:hypothetical protein